MLSCWIKLDSVVMHALCIKIRFGVARERRSIWEVQLYQEGKKSSEKSIQIFWFLTDTGAPWQIFKYSSNMWKFSLLDLFFFIL